MAASTVRPTLPGRVPGRLYDERGNEVFVRVEAFNRLPYGRRPRVYDHMGRRILLMEEPATVVPDVAAKASSDGSAVLVAINVLLGILRAFVRLLTLLARLV